MPHRRLRHIAALIRKQASFWPVVGVMGMRQAGKTTLFREQLSAKTYVTMDDDDVRADAAASPKSFLSKFPSPLVIDEAQKAPAVFDAVKSAVDRKRTPGRFFLTGSSSFSGQKDIRESLTGRIGLCSLHPMTLAEIHEAGLATDRAAAVHAKKPRFTVEQVSAQLAAGGLPLPAFTRDTSMRARYWRNWLDTTLGRDLARVYGKGYDSDVASKLVHEMAKILSRGELPTLASFSADSRKTKKYLNAMRAVFMVRRIACHEAGVGRDAYLFADSGLAHAMMNQAWSEEITSSLIRILLINEISANSHYAGEEPHLSYFKSRKGSPVDLVWDGVPVKFITSVNRTGWEERALHGAMQALKSDAGLLAGPTDTVTLPKRGKGVGLVPWAFWS